MSDKVKLTKEQKAMLTAWLDNADKNSNGALLLPFEGKAVGNFFITNALPTLKTITPTVNGKPFPINLVVMNITDSEDRIHKEIGCNYNRSMRDAILNPEVYDKPYELNVITTKSAVGNLYSRVNVGEIVED